MNTLSDKAIAQADRDALRGLWRALVDAGGAMTVARFGAGNRVDDFNRKVTGGMLVIERMLHPDRFDEYPSGREIDAAEPHGEAPSLHPETASLVDRFAAALKEKLADAERKYGYTNGWASPDWMDECRAHLMQHIAKGDPRDVANYCMFLWRHGESTAPAERAEDAEAFARKLEEIADTRDRIMPGSLREAASLLRRLAAEHGKDRKDAERRVDENDALDAKRYRFIRKPGRNLATLLAIVVSIDMNCPIKALRHSHYLDRAIDAAMAQEAGNG